MKRAGRGLAGRIWKGSLLIQTLHREFDVSCYSTHNITLIRGTYSPFTHGKHVRYASSAIVRCSQMRQTLSLSIPRQAARRTILEPSYTWWALARETWAGLCRSLVALLLSRRAVRNEGRSPSPCWVRQSLQAYCRQKRGTLVNGVLVDTRVLSQFFPLALPAPLRSEVAPPPSAWILRRAQVKYRAMTSPSIRAELSKPEAELSVVSE